MACDFGSIWKKRIPKRLHSCLQSWKVTCVASRLLLLITFVKALCLKSLPLESFEALPQALRICKQDLRRLPPQGMQSSSEAWLDMHCNIPSLSLHPALYNSSLLALSKPAIIACNCLASSAKQAAGVVIFAWYSHLFGSST